MSGVLGVLTWPEAEVEAELDPVRDMTGFGVGDGGRRGHNGLDGSKGGGLLFL